MWYSLAPISHATPCLSSLFSLFLHDCFIRSQWLKVHTTKDLQEFPLLLFIWYERIGQVEERSSRHPPYCFHLSNVFRSVQMKKRRRRKEATLDYWDESSLDYWDVPSIHSNWNSPSTSMTILQRTEEILNNGLRPDCRCKVSVIWVEIHTLEFLNLDQHKGVSWRSPGSLIISNKHWEVVQKNHIEYLHYMTLG